MKSIFTFLLTVFLIQNIYSQDNKESIDQAVNEIKANSAKYEKIIELDDSLAYKCVYLQDKKLQFIELSFKDENINKNVEWYFKDNEFIYGEALWIDDVKNIQSNKNIVYFYNSELIYWNKDDISIESSSEDFKKYNKEIKDYVKKMKTKYI